MKQLDRLYVPVLNWAIANRKIVMAGAAVLVVMTIVFARLLGLEFLPKLEEGNLWIRATLPPTISLQEGNAYVNEMRKMIRARPEVESVVSQHGRPDDGTDAAGLFNAEFFAPLKPNSEWPGTRDKDELTAELLAQLQDKFPGVEFNFSQYLQDNVSEAVSGVKGENSIKLYGNDLQALTDTANKIKSVLGTVQGVTDLAVFTSLGQPTIQIDIDRARAARYGLSPGDINATIKVAVGGDSAGDLYEPGSDRHFPIIVRLAPEYRKSAEAIHNLRIGVAGQGGAITQIPLSEVASINLISGAAYIYREAAGALSADQVLGAQPRPRQRDPGSAGQGRGPGPAAAGIAGRMGRRVRQSAGRHQAAVDRGADQPRADRRAAVLQFRLDGRHAARHERDPDGDLRRRARAADHGHSRSACRRRSASSRCSASP